MKTIVILVITAYQRLLSPFLGPACRFAPTCSEYMIESIEKKGLCRGVVKGIWRILRCNPFSSGGYDAVE
ncbi:membrane protein insertion efficiency factor YidD [bacterium]|nr:membrane protein insertion efficiency factor YidD [bacterium]